MGGCLMTAMAALGLSWRLFKLIPSSVKEAMPVGLGLMLALCGFEQMRLVIPSRDTGVTMGDLQEPNVRRREEDILVTLPWGGLPGCAVCCALCAARVPCVGCCLPYIRPLTHMWCSPSSSPSSLGTFGRPWSGDDGVYAQQTMDVSFHPPHRHTHHYRVGFHARKLAPLQA